MEASLKTSSKTGSGVAINWSEVSLVIASAQLKQDKAAEFLRVDKFPPPTVEVYTPEWLVYLRQEKKIPPEGSMLSWSEQQQVHEEAAQHEQHCEEVAQQLEEKRARKKKSDDSDSDEGSNSDNSATRKSCERHPCISTAKKFANSKQNLTRRTANWWKSAHLSFTRTTQVSDRLTR